MKLAAEFTLQVEQVDGFEFRVRFDKEHYPELHLDEPPPLGRDSAPSAARILAAAIGNCLAASLVFCLKRRAIEVAGLRSEVHVRLVRNESARLRIGDVAVIIQPHGAIDSAALDACVQSFEDFCVVTQSVREGIPVSVEVRPAAVAP